MGYVRQDSQRTIGAHWIEHHADDVDGLYQHDRPHRRPNPIRWRWRAGDMVNHLHIERKLNQ
jgi:hypothetical protein